MSLKIVQEQTSRDGLEENEASPSVAAAASAPVVAALPWWATGGFLVVLVATVRLILDLAWRSANEGLPGLPVPLSDSQTLGTPLLGAVAGTILVLIAARWCFVLGGGVVASLAGALGAVACPTLWYFEWQGGGAQLLVLGLALTFPVVLQALLGRYGQGREVTTFVGLASATFWLLWFGGPYSAAAPSPAGGVFIIGGTQVLVSIVAWLWLVMRSRRQSSAKLEPALRPLALWIAATSLVLFVALATRSPQAQALAGVLLAVSSGVGIELTSARARSRTWRGLVFVLLVAQFAWLAWWLVFSRI